MARAWIIAGRPEGSNTTLGSFESWCEVVGGILEYAGLNGFLDNLQAMHRDTTDGDGDAEQWGAFMGAIFAEFQGEQWTIKELFKRMRGLTSEDCYLRYLAKSNRLRKDESPSQTVLKKVEP
jgi:hypothetical protein